MTVSQYSKPEIKAEDIAAALPDLDSLDSGTIELDKLLDPSVNMRET